MNLISLTNKQIKFRLLILSFLILVLSILVVYKIVKNEIFQDYNNPAYIEYFDSVTYCNQFYGGPKPSEVTNKHDPNIYKRWKAKEIIGC